VLVLCGSLLSLVAEVWSVVVGVVAGVVGIGVGAR
jgi:hypothetical protein